MSNARLIAACLSLGRVVECYAARAKARIDLKTEKDALDRAREDEARFGGFEDCGSSYQASLSEAQGAFGVRLSHKISAEKRYKATRLTFGETYPEMVPMLERTLLTIQGGGHTTT